MNLVDDIAVTPLVAVYGTLKKSLDNAHWLNDAQWVGHDVSHALTLYDIGPYPGAKQQTSQGIALEVYRVSAAQLAALDKLEDYRPEAPDKGEYQRVIMPTCFGSAWVYLYNPDVTGRPMIRRGGWPSST